MDGQDVSETRAVSETEVTALVVTLKRSSNQRNLALPWLADVGCVGRFHLSTSGQQPRDVLPLEFVALYDRN